MRAVESESETGLSAEFAMVSATVRSALRADLVASGKSRDQVAVDLADAIGRQVTVEQIDAFVAPSKPHRFPAEWIPAWVQVTGSRRMLDLLCEPLGLSLANEQDRDFAALGRAQITQERLVRKLWARS